MNILKLIGRKETLFEGDVTKHSDLLHNIVSNSRFLVLGGAGSIGQAVVKEIFKRNPRKLHVVDISENNLVELVRDVRSSFGYIDGDFRTFALDIGSIEYDAFINSDGNYDYVLNLSALKHVRSEKDPFTLMRMVDVNIFNTIKTIKQATKKNSKKYFCVSTDKAANPVNLMGASKRIMELFLMSMGHELPISTARFANVAFSDGSLLYGFDQRIAKNQPIVAPNDVKRYFVTPKESGELCLLSCLLGEDGDVFFPKLSEQLHLISFAEIAVKYLESKNLRPIILNTEEEARDATTKLDLTKEWPCYFTSSDTTGEKDFEEFYTDAEILDLNRFEKLGVIKKDIQKSTDKEILSHFELKIKELKSNRTWTKNEIVDLFYTVLPELDYNDVGKYLDEKM